MRVTTETPGTEELLVLLDGLPVGFVVAADDEEGWVDRVMPNEWRGEAGLPQVEDDTKPTRQHGKVEFQWPKTPWVSNETQLGKTVSRSKYQAVWKPNSLNEAFWREVLEGRKIDRISFDEHGISALVLDSGETVFLPVELKGGRLMIRD